MTEIERIEVLRELTRGWLKDQCHASEMTAEQIELAEQLCAEGLLGNFGRAVHPGGVYCFTLEGEIALGRPPKWWTDASPREKATHDKPYNRTEEDYLTILTERPDASFGELDNVELLFDMRARGLIEWRPDKVSKHSGMFAQLYPMLTDAGRAALPQTIE